MTEAAVRVQNLRKAFPGREVLSDVSFEVPRGRTLALLGRNGAGKTTALRILLGLLPADGGTVRVLGRDPAREPLDLRRFTKPTGVGPAWRCAQRACRTYRPGSTGVFARPRTGARRAGARGAPSV